MPPSCCSGVENGKIYTIKNTIEIGLLRFKEY